MKFSFSHADKIHLRRESCYQPLSDSTDALAVDSSQDS